MLDVATQTPMLEIQIHRNENDYRNYCEFANSFTPIHDFTSSFNLQLESPLVRAAIRSTFLSQCNHEVDKMLFRRFEIACCPAAPPLPLCCNCKRSRRRSLLVDFNSLEVVLLVDANCTIGTIKFIRVRYTATMYRSDYSFTIVLG